MPLPKNRKLLKLSDELVDTMRTTFDIPQNSPKHPYSPTPPLTSSCDIAPTPASRTFPTTARTAPAASQSVSSSPATAAHYDIITNNSFGFIVSTGEGFLEQFKAVKAGKMNEWVEANPHAKCFPGKPGAKSYRCLQKFAGASGDYSEGVPIALLSFHTRFFATPPHHDMVTYRISHPSHSQPSQLFSQPTILHQNSCTFTPIHLSDDDNDALFVSGGSGEDPSRSIFDSDEFDDAGKRDGEGDDWEEMEAEGLEEEQAAELREMNEEVEGVEFLAHWRVFCGKERVGAMENTEEDSSPAPATAASKPKGIMAHSDSEPSAGTVLIAIPTQLGLTLFGWSTIASVPSPPPSTLPVKQRTPDGYKPSEKSAPSPSGDSFTASAKNVSNSKASGPTRISWWILILYSDPPLPQEGPTVDTGKEPGHPKGFQPRIARNKAWVKPEACS
ncbi:hypothetical protein BU25DRAFT_417469 [Macroventuria anomochaeta]|uniref:Uncharacterized protein n=1 Tax=Macroventuria anomochaeta TaxID=301207 RepID=A0ACB6SFX9_9PLEO|nr:uncharacterized protein BU25DRAFT_417469 [Macroventuria anomochaeta]KAF2632898.1 hypothetical protein BU25DRAFT_417469 [Macroventuria anomochaeta]